jgi:hypothetical protein
MGTSPLRGSHPPTTLLSQPCRRVRRQYFQNGAKHWPLEPALREPLVPLPLQALHPVPPLPLQPLQQPLRPRLLSWAAWAP